MQLLIVAVHRGNAACLELVQCHTARWDEFSMFVLLYCIIYLQWIKADGCKRLTAVYHGPNDKAMLSLFRVVHVH